VVKCKQREVSTCRCLTNGSSCLIKLGDTPRAAAGSFGENLK
jgi:hypothetical protein